MTRTTAWLSISAATLVALAFPSSASAGPTALESWSPDAAWPTFKTAAVCHDNERDVYGIVAVFQVFDHYLGGYYDQLYYLRVQGDSTAPDYGQLVSEQLLTAAWRIDHVDCASDDGNNVFVTWDRRWQDAQWARIDGTSTWGPYHVDAGGVCSPYTHRPRIAFGEDDRVMVAFEGYHYTHPEYASCEVCLQQYDAYSGAEVPGTDTLLWKYAGMTHSDYDLEWGNDAFVVALPLWSDTLPDQELAMYAVDLDNTLTEQHLPPENIIDQFQDLDGYPSRVKLVHSDNANNETDAMFLETDRKSYWLDGSGALLDAPLDNPTDERMGVCEYWGDDEAVAHVFAPELRFQYIPGFPWGHFISYWQTVRHHFGVLRGYAYESFNVTTAYAPVACDGANTYDDAEVALVQTPIAGPDDAVYWNLQEND